MASARHDHAGRHGGVRRHVQEGPADIEIGLAFPHEEQGRRRVDAHADERHPRAATIDNLALQAVPLKYTRLIGIGLERLSPLAIVAIGGLMVSTFLTMAYVPVLYSLFEDLQQTVRRGLRPEPPHPVRGRTWFLRWGLADPAGASEM